MRGKPENQKRKEKMHYQKIAVGVLLSPPRGQNTFLESTLLLLFPGGIYKKVRNPEDW